MFSIVLHFVNFAISRSSGEKHVGSWKEVKKGGDVTTVKHDRNTIERGIPLTVQLIIAAELTCETTTHLQRPRCLFSRQQRECIEFRLPFVPRLGSF